MFCSKEPQRWDEYIQQTFMAYTSRSSTDDAEKRGNSSFTDSNRNRQQNNDEPEVGKRDTKMYM